MQNKEKGKTKRRDRIGELLDRAVQQPTVSEKTSDMVDRWLLDNENDPETNREILERFESDLDYSRKPSAEARESWLQAIRKLGMDQASDTNRLGLKSTTERNTPKIPLYRRTYFRVASAAAVVAVALVATFTVLNRDTTDTPPVTAQVETYSIEAIAGINKEAYLADSTRVWVNENSKLTAPVAFNGNGERHVDLEGEARFDVRHEDAKPFFVHTEHLDVRVLGTEFDVEAYPEYNYTIVSLYEGSVEAAAGDKREVLAPGERLTYYHESGDMQVDKIPGETESDWRTDAIFATGKTIPELLDMIANYYDVEVHYNPAAFDDKTYVLGFDKNDPVEKALSVLSDISGKFGYDYDRDAAKVDIRERQ